MSRRELDSLHPDLAEGEKSRLFAAGVALFDEGRYFEAHEPWETIWRSRDPEPRDFYQGLVQVAAGFHHWFASRRPGAAARLLARGERRLAEFEASGSLSDLRDLRALLTQVRAWIEWLAEHEGEPPPAPRLGTGNRRSSDPEATP